MKVVTHATGIIIGLMLILGCQQALKEAFISGEEIDQQLVNYARPENGTVIYTSEDNPDHPASTLANGVTESEKWDAGEGWQAYFEGLYEYGRYTGYGENAWIAERRLLQMNQEARLRGERVDPRKRIDPGDVDQEDYRSRGLNHMDLYGGMIPSALGWIVFELPEEKLITRVIIYTVDSEKYPASQYGVRDLVVQYWAPQARGWNNVDRLNKKVGDQHDSIHDNKEGRIVVRFRPVQTSKIRVVIRWTNDSETYRKIDYYRYVRGTIRLTEIEIYGLEKKDELAAAPSNPEADADEQLLDEILTTPSAVPPAKPPAAPPATEAPPQEQIEDVIRAYASAYDSRNLDALMRSISPSYSRDGEDYQGLRDKMAGLFQKYTQIDFGLQRLRIQPADDSATVEADYVVALGTSGDSSATLSGKLFFSLIEAENGWQITRIDTQR